MPSREAQSMKKSLFPPREQLGIVLVILLSVLLVLWELWSLFHLPSEAVHNRRFEHTFKNFGSYARLALFFVLANYVLMAAMKQRLGERFRSIKKWLAVLLRFVRRWHTPVAVVAIALILLHAVAVFMYGFKWNFSNITGLLALIVLLPVPVSGVFRYKKLDRKWHLRSGLAFAVLFLIHAFL
ncbi:hypothetical protein GCM10023310_33080 [Paenibacillus vulneris]